MKLINSEVLTKMLEPIKDILSNNIYARVCPVLDDRSWIILGVLKTLSKNDSGRAYLEQIVNDCEDYLSLSHLFETLKSQRRLNYCQETNSRLVDIEKNKTCKADPFAEFSELDDFDIYAGDGHHHDAPVHEIKVMGKVYSTQHFYSLNLRNLMLSHIKLAEYGGTRKKEHDMRVLKSLTTKELRQGAKKGRKVLYMWDKAGIDFYQWFKWNRAGIYFLTPEKKLNKLLVISQPLFSKDDPVNFGVINDETTSSANGVSVRRVTYQCPETEKIFTFITNLPRSIRPGVVAYLYKHRWDIEKKFNSFKHKLYERKAWGTSENAKNMQAAFICLTHNLMTILNVSLEDEVSMAQKDLERQNIRAKKVVEKAKKSGRKVAPHLSKACRIVELPKRFFSWLRSWVFKDKPWHVAIERLRIMFRNDNFSKGVAIGQRKRARCDNMLLAK